MCKAKLSLMYRDACFRAMIYTEIFMPQRSPKKVLVFLGHANKYYIILYYIVSII